MASKVDRRFHLITPLVDIEADGWSAAPRLARGATAALAIATRHEIAGAGIEALLQAAGHRVVARCLREDDLLHSLESSSPDIIILAESIVGQEAAKIVSQLRARNCSVAIIFLLEGRDTTTIAGLLDLHVEGILLSTACARTFNDCVDSVRYGRKWVDPDLLRHLAIAERPPLTSRETDVAHLILEGLHNKEIAQALHLSEGTVKMHLHHIYEKLHISGRTQLMLLMAGAFARMTASGNEDRRRRGEGGV